MHQGYRPVCVHHYDARFLLSAAPKALRGRELRASLPCRGGFRQRRTGARRPKAGIVPAHDGRAVSSQALVCTGLTDRKILRCSPLPPQAGGPCHRQAGMEGLLASGETSRLRMTKSSVVVLLTGATYAEHAAASGVLFSCHSEERSDEESLSRPAFEGEKILRSRSG